MGLRSASGGVGAAKLASARWYASPVLLACCQSAPPSATNPNPAANPLPSLFRASLPSQRYKICSAHCVMPGIVKDGRVLRFCQQVGVACCPSTLGSPG